MRLPRGSMYRMNCEHSKRVYTRCVRVSGRDRAGKRDGAGTHTGMSHKHLCTIIC